MKAEKIVELEVMRWALNNKWSIDVYDSKASYSVARKAYYKNRSIVEGHSDLAGCDSQGRAVYVELKAPKKENTLRIEQYKFLIRKIESNCFAVVVTSANTLQEYWDKWLSLEMNQDRAIYLKNLLPKKVKIGTRINTVKSDF